VNAASAVLLLDEPGNRPFSDSSPVIPAKAKKDEMAYMGFRSAARTGLIPMTIIDAEIEDDRQQDKAGRN